MKITRLEIADYQQFKDFAIDLTYPAGHPKAGEPLDKICLIGQSGTGKTTILNVITHLIGEDIIYRHSKIQDNDLFFESDDKAKIEVLHNFGAGVRKFWIETHKFTDINKGKDDLTIHDAIEMLVKVAEPDALQNPSKAIKLLYFEVGVQEQINLLASSKPVEDRDVIAKTREENAEKYLKRLKIEYDEREHKLSNVIFSNFDFKYDFFKDLLLQSLNSYDKKHFQYMKDFNKNINPQNSQKLAENLLKWLKENPNPRIEMAKRINKIINIFNLKIDEDWIEGGIKIKTLQDEEIPLKNLSTGTRLILLTSVVLYLLDLKDKIILFDEAESSLYPDIQRIIIDFYTDLSPEAQFFFATHSPLIASQFEPWEIVELKFNKEGKVYRELYYEGENHVDNYTIFPQYLSWDSILTKVFDLEVRGNEKHQTKLKELAILEVKLRNASQEQKRAIWEQYEKLANLLDWQIDK